MNFRSFQKEFIQILAVLAAKGILLVLCSMPQEASSSLFSPHTAQMIIKERSLVGQGSSIKK